MTVKSNMIFLSSLEHDRDRNTKLTFIKKQSFNIKSEHSNTTYVVQKALIFNSLDFTYQRHPYLSYS